jgi:hypothetical protein
MYIVLTEKEKLDNIKIVISQESVISSTGRTGPIEEILKYAGITG